MRDGLYVKLTSHQVFGRFGFGRSGRFPELPKQPKSSKRLSAFLSKVHCSECRFDDSESTQTALRAFFRLHLSIHNRQNAARKWILIAKTLLIIVTECK